MAKRPLSLNAYLAFARGSVEGKWTPSHEHPPGASLWLHAGEPDHLPGLLGLAERARLQRGDLNVVLTGVHPEDCPPWIALEPSPAETIGQCDAFLQHWRPAICIWAGNDLRPALVHCASKAGCELMLVNAEDDVFSTPGLRWLPDAAPATLHLFRQISATGIEAKARLLRLGVSAQKIQTLGPLDEAPLPLSCDSQDLDDYSAALNARPVWLAAAVTSDELNAVLLAHRRALRASHRLLLILVPAKTLGGNDLSRAMTYVGLRSETASPDAARADVNQVIVAEDCEDMGLWLRLAPVTFLGGSLTDGVGGHTPYHAASLGSCIFCGPNVRRHARAYARLAEAGAARVVRDAEALATEVARAILPDRSAAMAHAGWDVITGGAQLTDGLVERILETLDRAEVI